eukprot:CAMPEP_0115579730 /NCGR_PEP_ID=MMETSP0272-20121206/4255_1 /TAXON_ID=71861 /ORGANISM="Scrippsiella trochoidea, Strain CCMP3099" /LENGTH=79 /DNA_ID=CAMNT_0003014615 /DNA_START=137 /DNA_END=379 /DNA_ORIENTATION=-
MSLSSTDKSLQTTPITVKLVADTNRRKLKPAHEMATPVTHERLTANTAALLHSAVTDGSGPSLKNNEDTITNGTERTLL